MKIKKITYLFYVLLLAACGTRQKLSPEAYVQHINSAESEALVTKELNGIRYKLRLLTPEYMALSNMRGHTNTHEFEENLKNYRQQATFVFVIEDADKNQGQVKSRVFDPAAYGTILGYANTDLKYDFMLLRERDTLYCNLVHIEPANSLQPVIRLSLAFDLPTGAPGGFTFLFNDNIFNNGPLKFTYSNQVIAGLPELNM